MHTHSGKRETVVYVYHAPHYDRTKRGRTATGVRRVPAPPGVGMPGGPLSECGEASGRPLGRGREALRALRAVKCPVSLRTVPVIRLLFPSSSSIAQ